MNGEGEVKRTREFAGDGLHGESKVGEESLIGGGEESLRRGGGEESLRGGGEESQRGGGEELLLLFCIFLICVFENNVKIFL